MYDSQDDAPEPLREHLVEKDGKWILDVEGYVTKDMLNEFRTNNRALNRDKEKLQKDYEALQTEHAEFQGKYKDIDPDEYKSLKAAPTDIQKQITEVEARLAKKYEGMFAERDAVAKANEMKFHHALISNEVAMAAPKVGIHETALEDLQTRASRVFRVTEGKVVPFQGEDPIYSDREPSRFLSMEEWLGGLSKTYPHYFKSSSGGGANNGLGGQSRNGRNVVAASDSKAFLQNLEKIARGEVEVDMSA
jgi:hypothetical protein